MSNQIIEDLVYVDPIELIDHFHKICLFLQFMCIFILPYLLLYILHIYLKKVSRSVIILISSDL